MKRFICVVFALLFAVFAAACTTGVDNGGTTTSSDVGNVSVSTTQLSDASNSKTSTTTSPTQQSGEVTTDNNNDTSVTSTSANNTTSVQNSTRPDFPYNVATYAEYPYVPDYGAMLGITPAVKKEGGYSYRLDTVVMADPQGKSGTDYMNLLKDCGYVPVGSKEEAGVNGLVFTHPEYKTAVFFAAAPEKGYIVVLISAQ